MFWLKKIVSQLFMPVPLVLLLIVFAYLMVRSRKFARLILASSALLLVVMSSGWGSNYLLQHLESQYKVNNTAIPRGCLVMVLGSGHDENNQLSAVQQLSATALARLAEGLRQLSLGQDCKLVVSGWGGGLSSRSHAEVMADAAVELGVSRGRIISLPLAQDTIDEAQYMKWEVSDAPFRLVTSASHMPRAMAIFKDAKLNVTAAPTDFGVRESYWWKLDAQNLLSSQRAIHEYLGLLWFEINHSQASSEEDAARDGK